MDLLIKKGADVNAQNKESLTPLHCAAGKAHMDVMEVLIKHGAKVSREGVRAVEHTRSTTLRTSTVSLSGSTGCPVLAPVSTALAARSHAVSTALAARSHAVSTALPLGITL